MVKRITYYKKVAKNETTLLDQRTKKIHLYNLPTKILSVSRMELKGRHPEGNKVVLEKDCSFAMYVTRGKGKDLINGEIVQVGEGDVVFVRAGSTFIAEGNFEYITCVIPAYHPESTEEVEIK